MAESSQALPGGFFRGGSGPALVIAGNGRSRGSKSIRGTLSVRSFLGRVWGGAKFPGASVVEGTMLQYTAPSDQSMERLYSFLPSAPTGDFHNAVDHVVRPFSQSEGF